MPATTPQPNQDQSNEVQFVSGIGANGTLAPASFSTWNDDTPSTYATDWKNSVWRNTTDGSGAALPATTSTAGSGGGVVTYYFSPAGSGWTQSEKTGFVQVLTLYSDEDNIQFAQVTDPSKADIVINHVTNGSNGGPGPASYGSVGSAAVPVSTVTSGGSTAVLNQSTGVGWGDPGSFAITDSYGYQTAVHEIGHVLGLGHGGPYNYGTPGSSPATSQLGPYDFTNWTVMSYNPPDDTTTKYTGNATVAGVNWAVNGTPDANGSYLIYNASVTTPMPLDVLAMQRIYGPATTGSLSGGQVFGFNCNITDAAEPFFDFTKNQYPVITLWDSGTNNTLDLSGYTMACVVNLNPGTFSSVGGLSGNLGIAFNTAIDTLVGSQGGGTYTVNGDADTITGSGGTTVVALPEARANYTVTFDNAGNAMVTEATTGIVDRLNQVQSLQFADTTVAVPGAPVPTTPTGGSPAPAGLGVMNAVPVDLTANQTTAVATIKTNGDTLGVRLANGMPGRIVLGAVQGDLQEVLYQAPDDVIASDDETIDFTVDDLTTGTSTTDEVSVELDAGLLIQDQIPDGTTVAPGSTVLVGRVQPGAEFDSLSIASDSGASLELVDLDNGETGVALTVPANATGTIPLSYTISADDGQETSGAATLVVGSGASALGSIPVERFFDTVTGSHFYTDSAVEAAAIQATRPDLRLEGSALESVNPGTFDTAAAPIYRFYDTTNGAHFYTMSAAEVAQVQATRPDLTYEGTAFTEDATQQAGDVPVYRFFETGTGSHFYTSNAQEYANVIATRPDLKLEGVAFWAPSS